MGEDLNERFEAFARDVRSQLDLLAKMDALAKINQDKEVLLAKKEKEIRDIEAKLRLKEQALVDQAKYIHLKNAELAHQEEQLSIKHQKDIEDHSTWAENMSRVQREYREVELKIKKSRDEMEVLTQRHADLVAREEIIKRDTEVIRVRTERLEDREKVIVDKERHLQRVSDAIRNKEIELESRRGHLKTV